MTAKEDHGEKLAELRERVSVMPNAPGVYLMKDDDGVVLYVGKAKNLKSRVRSYISGNDSRYRIQFLMELVESIETLVTENERQALVLEADLIKKYRPKYNVRLKDDKSHLIVRVDYNAEWPRLELVRRMEHDGAKYIGPFVFGHELRTLLETLKRTFPLRTCTDRVMHNRVRPCLEHQIKRCVGPCCLDVDHSEYMQLVDQAVAVLEGDNEGVVLELEQRMEAASADMQYEDAAVYRDRIEVLKRMREEQAVPQFGEGSQDAFGFYRQGADVEISLLMVRFGRLYESRSHGFSDVEIPDDELFSSLLSQYYLSAKEFPEEVLIPFEFEDSDVLEALLCERAGADIRVLVPKRGVRKRLLDLASENTKQNYRSRFAAGEKANAALKELEAKLSLDQMPRTIECVDVSHIQGRATVASVVHFVDGEPDKSRYRHFHLSQEGKPDDFASMREVLMRHLSRGQEENTLVDLMIVDGGQAQLSQAVSVMKELGLSKPAVIGLAKKRRGRVPYRIYQSRKQSVGKPERVYLPDEKEAVVLAPGSAALTLLERVRDEAHRFAITFHREKRSKQTLTSSLDSIPGVGRKRKLSLLREFGSVAAIRESAPEELVNRAQIPLPLAKRVVEFLSSEESNDEPEW